MPVLISAGDFSFSLSSVFCSNTLYLSALLSSIVCESFSFLLRISLKVSESVSGDLRAVSADLSCPGILIQVYKCPFSLIIFKLLLHNLLPCKKPNSSMYSFIRFCPQEISKTESHILLFSLSATARISPPATRNLWIPAWNRCNTKFKIRIASHGYCRLP